MKKVIYREENKREKKEKKEEREVVVLENQEAKSDRKLGDRLEKPVSGSCFSFIFFLFFS